MLNPIKVLIVGLEPYSKVGDYEPFTYNNYPFPTVAFIPKLKEKNKDKNKLYEITSYRRIMSFLAGKALNEKEFSKYEEIKSIVDELIKEGIYLTNIREIEKNKINCLTNKLAKDAIVILFGKDTQKEWNSKIGKNKEIKIIKFYHPSPRVQNSNWYKFDYEMQLRNEERLSKIKELEEEFKFTM